MGWRGGIASPVEYRPADKVDRTVDSGPFIYFANIIYELETHWIDVFGEIAQIKENSNGGSQRNKIEKDQYRIIYLRYIAARVDTNREAPAHSGKGNRSEGGGGGGGRNSSRDIELNVADLCV